MMSERWDWIEHWVDEETGLLGKRGLMICEPGEDRYALAEAELIKAGCGAWTGRTACAEPPTWSAAGGPALMFMTRQSVHTIEFATAAVLCDRHAEGLTRDMPRQFRRAQDREFQKFLKKTGIEDERARVIVLHQMGDAA